ncbi:Hypothetical predicted protein [Podarcis lilfordi]|uniref:ribonuclease H n=1 Tax=Podarcis lilfordi TaxID=74358 RepID=A0AA35LN90_9SAUR|nr:Hypothetical predicted protein [Podarcis lilfordi]
MPSAATPDMMPDTQGVPESPPLTQVDDPPGTSAALFNDAQFSGTGPSSQAVAAAVHTRSRAHLASSGPQNSIGLPARRPPACVNNAVASSSFSPSQNKQPRVQLPESGTSSAGEEEQQLEGELQTAEVAVIPYVEKKPLDSYRMGKQDPRGEPKRKGGMLVLEAMIDSGASGVFMDISFTEKYQLLAVIQRIGHQKLLRKYKINGKEKDRKFFAFTVPVLNNSQPMERYQWKVLPQGMLNSPTMCQYYVNQALQPFRLQVLAGFPHAASAYTMAWRQTLPDPIPQFDRKLQIAQDAASSPPRTRKQGNHEKHQNFQPSL